MNDLEFYTFEGELWCIYPDGNNRIVTESDTELVRNILERIRESYPEAYKALEGIYKKSALNVPYYQYLMVRRFCKCNFGNLDNKDKDVDRSGTFHFERVNCPLRKECPYEGIICGARFSSALSKAEYRVMKLVYDGVSREDIASQLYLSPDTVKNHIKSAYRKTGVHAESEFVQYANKNNLFTD